MKLSPGHERLLRITLAAGQEFGLILAGGYALQAHELLTRPSKDLDFATDRSQPLEEIAEHMSEFYRAAGFESCVVEATSRMARLELTSAEGDFFEVDLLKEALWSPPILVDEGPVLGLEDAIGLKVRALHDRGLPRDFMDVHAARTQFSEREMEALGSRHNEEFSLEELHDRLGGIEYIDDAEFHALGIDDNEIAALRDWALTWRQELAARVMEASPWNDNDLAQ